MLSRHRKTATGEVAQMLSIFAVILLIVGLVGGSAWFWHDNIGVVEREVLVLEVERWVVPSMPSGSSRTDYHIRGRVINTDEIVDARLSKPTQVGDILTLRFRATSGKHVSGHWGFAFFAVICVSTATFILVIVVAVKRHHAGYDATAQ